MGNQFGQAAHVFGIDVEKKNAAILRILQSLFHVGGVRVPADGMLMDSFVDGMVSENTDGTYAVEWTAYEGKGIEADANQVENLGRIEVEFDPVIVAAIQDGTALLAIVSD